MAPGLKIRVSAVRFCPWPPFRSAALEDGLLRVYPSIPALADSVTSMPLRCALTFLKAWWLSLLASHGCVLISCAGRQYSSRIRSNHIAMLPSEDIAPSLGSSSSASPALIGATAGLRSQAARTTCPAAVSVVALLHSETAFESTQLPRLAVAAYSAARAKRRLVPRMQSNCQTST